MQRIRLFSQIVFFLLFLLFFLLASYPLKHHVPVDLFLRMDPLAALTAGLGARTFLWKWLPALLVLCVTLFLGRFFCGWVCPMGSSVDGYDAAVKAKANNQKLHVKSLRWLKYFLLLIFLAAALFSIQIAGWLDPIPLITRSMVAVLYPLAAFVIFGIFGMLYTLSFLEDILFPIEEALRGTLLPLNPVVFRGSLLIFVVLIIILMAGKIQRRFWCRYICPLGGLLALTSKFRLYKRRVEDSCTSCGKCERVCRMGAIGKDFVTTSHTECINCMDCKAVCPVNAVYFDFRGKKAAEPIDLKKRHLLTAGFTGLVLAGMGKIGFSDKVKKGETVRPPGAVPEPEFLDRCIRCGECIRICATAGQGLQFAGFEAGWQGLGTPLLKTPDGYCEHNCNLCGKVCPTGAIHSLTLEEKHDMKMGTAHFDKTRCIPWYYGEDCMVCEEHCPLDEKAIKFIETGVTTIDGRQGTVLLPYVDEILCTGCGICTSVCPVEGNKGIFLTNMNEIRWEE